MNFYEAVVYGTIQGLSEFLPVSSSGHLALLPYVMKIDDPGVVFDLMMHLGTALAVLFYFKKEILGYLKCLSPKFFDLSYHDKDMFFVRNFTFATFVSVFFIVLFMPLAKLARDPYFIVLNLFVFGALLWVADILNSRNENLLDSPMETSMQWRLAGLIGFAQSIAIFPGVSRSGITLSIALVLGMRRKDAGAFSFLLSLPIIFAGILKELPRVMTNHQSNSLEVLISGVLVSFLVGWLTVKYFMKLITKIQLSYFAIYRWILALVMFFTLKT